MGWRHRARTATIIAGLVIGVPLAIATGFAIRRLYVESTAPEYAPKTMPLHRVTAGDAGPKVLLLHGHLASSGYFTRRLGSFTTEHRVLAPDLLGFGRSPKPVAEYDVETQVGAVQRVMVSEGFGASGTVIVAHSMGTIVAFGMIAHAPDAYAGAVLIGTPVFEGMADARARLGRDSVVMRMSLDGHWLMRGLCAYHDVFRIGALAPLFDLPEDVYLDGGRHTWLSEYNSLRNTIILSDLDELARGIDERRILFLHGSEDKVSDLAPARALAARMGARFEVVAGAGHQLFLDDPDRVWDRVRAFEATLAELPARNLR